MWFFAWILGLTSALSIAIINVMWYEAEESFKEAENRNEKT